MTTTTQASLIYLAYAVMASLGVVHLETAFGIAVFLGAVTPDIMNYARGRNDAQGVYLSTDMLLAPLAMGVVLLVVAPALLAPLGMFLFAFGLRLLIAFHLPTGVQFQRIVRRGAFTLSLTPPRDFAARWLSFCLTISLIADTIVPRALLQGMHIVTDLKAGGLI